jgi:uncharacterized protein
MPIQHGLTVVEVSDGVRMISTVATAVIGLIATGPAADAAAFPLDAPKLVTSLVDAIAKAGATGTLKQSLQAIADQVETPVVVVRVGTAQDPEDQDALVIAGLQKLLAAEANAGAKPRIIGAPGLDTLPVATAIIGVAEKLRAFGYAAAIGADTAALLEYRENFGARELELIYGNWLVTGAAGEPVAAPAVAYALGLRAKIDQQEGFHRSLSNVVVNGPIGIEEPVQFDIMDTGSEAGVLNAAGITCLVRREGFRFWGNRTTAEETSPFTFEVATRSAQILIDTIAEGLTWAIDKPLTKGLITDIVETINVKLRALVGDGKLLGARAWYDAARNPVSQLAGGTLVIDYDYTPVPPLEHLSLNQRITDSYTATLAS